MNDTGQVDMILVRLQKLNEFFETWKALQESSPKRRVRWEYRRIGTFPWNEGSPATPHIEFPYEYRIHPDELKGEKLMNELSKEDKARFEFAREYFDRRLKGEEPKWQCKLPSSGNWTHMKPTAIPSFLDNKEYRFTPKTITINGVEVVAPRLSNQESDKMVYMAMDITNSLFQENLQLRGTLVYDCLSDKKAFRAAVLAAVLAAVSHTEKIDS